MERKFDTFYYTEDRQLHTLSEVVAVSDIEFENEYKGKMYCPQCKLVQLSLSHGAKTTFLRTYPKQKHGSINGKPCEYAYKEASSHTIKLYIDELRDKRRIKSLLDSVMRHLMGSKVKSISINTKDDLIDDPLIIEPSDKFKNKERTVIPHYSFNSWGIAIPNDRLVIIYGKVKIKIKESEDGNYAYIHFRATDSDKFITSCLKPKTLDIKDGQYYAVLLGKRSENGIYQNIVLNKPESESIIITPFS